MSARIVPIEHQDQEVAASSRLDKLRTRRREAEQALEDFLIEEGLINTYAGSNGYTDLHRLLQAAEYASCAVEGYLERDLQRTLKQLGNVLAADAFSDEDARRAVVTTLNRHSKGRRVDKALYSEVEQEIIESYRRMDGDDRALVRLMFRRLGATLDVGRDDQPEAGAGR